LGPNYRKEQKENKKGFKLIEEVIGSRRAKGLKMER
jgi:hypothetical protein